MTTPEQYDEDPETIKSPLCQTITQGGHTIDVEIYQEEDSKWILEVVDVYNGSTLWHDMFDTDQEALDEVHRTIREEGIAVLVNPPK